MNVAANMGINPSGLIGSVTGNCLVLVNVSNVWKHALTMTSTLSFNADVNLNNFTLFANLTDATVS